MVTSDEWQWLDLEVGAMERFGQSTVVAEFHRECRAKQVEHMDLGGKMLVQELVSLGHPSLLFQRVAELQRHLKVLQQAEANLGEILLPNPSTPNGALAFRFISDHCPELLVPECAADEPRRRRLIEEEMRGASASTWLWVGDEVSRLGFEDPLESLRSICEASHVDEESIGMVLNMCLEMGVLPGSGVFGDYWVSPTIEISGQIASADPDQFMNFVPSQFPSEDVALEDLEAKYLNYHEVAPFNWNWSEVEGQSPPPPPTRVETQREVLATQKVGAALKLLRDFQPTFFQKLFGQTEKERMKVQEMVDAVENELSRAGDTADAEHAQALEEHKRRAAGCQADSTLAQEVLVLNEETVRSLIEDTGVLWPAGTIGLPPMVKLLSFSGTPHVSVSVPSVSAVPSKVTIVGERTTRQFSIPVKRRHTVQMEHLCSVAIGVTRALFSAVPFEGVQLDIVVPQPDAATGQTKERVYLSIQFAREEFAQLNFSRLTPSAAVKAVPHKLDFGPLKGLEAVSSLFGEG